MIGAQSWEKIKEKGHFQKCFFKLMSNLVFEKVMENGRKQRNIKLVTTEARGNYLVLELTYHREKSFWNLLVIEVKKPKIFINNPVCLALSILEKVK